MTRETKQAISINQTTATRLRRSVWLLMSKRKKKEGPAPMSSAGLVRYYEEDKGINISPGIVIAISIAFAVLVVLGDAGVFSALGLRRRRRFS